MIFSYLVNAFLFLKAWFREMDFKSEGSNKKSIKTLEKQWDFCDHCVICFPSNKHDVTWLDAHLVNNLSKIPFSFQYIIAGAKTEEATSSETQRREGGGKEKENKYFMILSGSHLLQQ